MKSVFLLMSCVLAMVTSFCNQDKGRWKCGLHFHPSLINRPLYDARNRPGRWESDSWESMESDSWESRESDSWESSDNRRCGYARVDRGWKDHYVYLINKKMSYTAAMRYCKRDGGNLVKIDDAWDDSEIMKLIHTRFCGFDEDYWIGLNKLDRWCRGYCWDLDRTNYDWSRWWKRAIQYHDCVAMVQEGNYDWSDEPCYKKKYFICEYPRRPWW